jgi:segregation and condensation protein B
MSDDQQLHIDVAVVDEPAMALVGAIESVLFAAGSALEPKRIAEILGDVDTGVVRRALALIQRGLDQRGAGTELVTNGGRVRLRTRVDFAQFAATTRGVHPVAPSKAALEVLSIVAYRQPVTRAEVEEIRGVSSGALLKKLTQRDLVAIAGRRDEPGRPLVYKTTRAFLAFFSLPSLDALPTLADLEESG